MVHTLLFVHVPCSCFVRLNIQSIWTQIAKDLILSETKSVEPECFYTVLKYHWHIIMRTLDPQIILFLSFLSNNFFIVFNNSFSKIFLLHALVVLVAMKNPNLVVREIFEDWVSSSLRRWVRPRWSAAQGKATSEDMGGSACEDKQDCCLICWDSIFSCSLFSYCICWWVQIMFPFRCKCLEFRIIREGFQQNCPGK